MSLKAAMFLILVAGVLAGCGKPTSYHPSDADTGYVDRSLGEGRWEVSFTANALTRQQRLKQYLLYRAAEISLDSGNDSFVVLDEHPGRGRLSGIKVEGEGTQRPYEFEHNHLWFDSRSFVEGYTTTVYEPMSRYTGTIVFRVFKGENPPQEGAVFDAREIIRTLGPQVFRKR